MDTVDREISECATYSDDRLTRELAEAARLEREGLVSLLIRLGEFFTRDLSLKYGYPSIYDYCMRVLGYSRTAAARRIAAAKAARRYRSVLTLLGRAELHLTGVAMLARHLTPENHESLLKRARGRPEEEIERMIAELSPRPLPKDRIRAIMAPAEEAGGVPTPALSPQAAGMPGADLFGRPIEGESARLKAELYEIAFLASRETRDLLARAKELLRHRFPRGETDGIVNLALKRLLTEIDRDLRKRRRTSHAQGTRAGLHPPTISVRAGFTPGRIRAERSRYIPEGVKQAAWERDGGRCSFVAPDGTRCAARAWLEFDHKTPYALGGSSLEAGNIRLYCRPHNQLAGRLDFGTLGHPRSSAA